MASYPPPDEKYKNLYNSQYFISKQQYAVSEGVENSFSDDYLRKDGSSIMTGHLTTPSIVLFNDGTIQFSDATVQNTAFTPVDRLNTSANQQKLTRQTYDSNTDTTHIAGSFKIKKIIFEDDNNKEQVIAFSQNDKDKIVTNETKLTNITFDSQQNKTTINNATHINSLTCGNISTSHLSGTTSNVQQQINSITADGITEEERDKLALLNIYDDAGKTVIYPDQIRLKNVIQENAFTTIHKNKVDTLDITEDRLFVNEIQYLDEFGGSEKQRKAFTDTHKTKLESDTLINSSNKLDASLIADGTISNAEFQSLNNITGNIEQRLYDMKIAPGVTSFNITNLTNVTLTQNTWANGSYEWTPSGGFLNGALHAINLTVECGNMTELTKLRSKIVIKLGPVVINESYFNGINLQSQTANEPLYNYNLTYYHYPNMALQHTVHVVTEYLFKCGGNCYCKARCQIAQLHF